MGDGGGSEKVGVLCPVEASKRFEACMCVSARTRRRLSGTRKSDLSVGLCQAFCIRITRARRNDERKPNTRSGVPAAFYRFSDCSKREDRKLILDYVLCSCGEEKES